MSKNVTSKSPKETTTDYAELRKQINDFESTFYGPHGCEHCGVEVVRMAREQGYHAFTVPKGEETKYKPHACDPTCGYAHFDSINYSVRHLAGKILTVVDATVSDPQQRKATKDIMKEAFKHALDQIRSGCFKYSVSGGCASTIEPLQEL
jgi:hypothetical protein